MKTEKQLLDELIAREGGYVDHPADRGGPTKYGITQSTARAHGYRGDMKDLPEATAREIYSRIYWCGPGFNMIAQRAPSVAAELFDTGVNTGPRVALTFLQRALNALNRGGRDYGDIVPDGRFGPASLHALDRYLAVRGRVGEIVLLRALEVLQGERYIHLAEANPSQEAFLYGWLSNRIGNL